jgi:hypothetical protein
VVYRSTAGPGAYAARLSPLGRHLLRLEGQRRR